MNEASPEAAGSLRLTLFARTDTSFTGVIELGPPAHGTGGAYVWHEGSELRISSVAASSGDTIYWTSKLTDEGIGGKFEITGGPREGQGGTWRARLTKGPPATVETLRLPNRGPRTPTTAMWPVLVVLAIGVGLTYWVRTAPERMIASAATAPRIRLLNDRTPGISGWLLLFVIGQGASILSSLIQFGSFRKEYTESMGVGAIVAGMQPLLVLELTLQILAPLLVVVGIILAVRHHRYAPRYWFSYLAFSVVFLALDLAMMYHIKARLGALLGATYLAASTQYDLIARGLLRALVVSTLWAVYWTRSERVRVTFGAAALDRTALPLPGGTSETLDAPAITGTAAVPGRRRRVVLRTIGAIIGVTAISVAIGLWQTHITPYSVPSGTDIRKTVAGRWTWVSDSAGCANAHVISFSDDGKVMTIFQPSHKVSEADVTTTYDIKLTSPSMIRGAIRGETRLDKDGKPVVWDLVLVGPDAYRWRRNDWFSAWGYTGSIMRCPAAAGA